MNEEYTELQEIKSEETYQIPKTKHIKFSRRDTVLNDWKNSTAEGIWSFILSLGAFILFGIAILLSYRSQGNGSVLLGLLAIISFIVSICSILLAIIGLKNRRKIRHYMERRGLILSGILIILLIILFIKGIGTL